MGRTHRLLFNDAAGADDTHGLYHSRLLCRHPFDVIIELLQWICSNACDCSSIHMYWVGYAAEVQSIIVTDKATSRRSLFEHMHIWLITTLRIWFSSFHPGWHKVNHGGFYYKIERKALIEVGETAWHDFYRCSIITLRTGCHTVHT